MANSPIRVGIAGLGRAGWNIHADALSKLPERYSVTAVFDTDTERLAEAESRFGATPYRSLDDFLADGSCELVVVALPSHLHEKTAIKAFSEKKNVLIEKPFADSFDGARRIVESAEKQGVIVSGSQNLRYEAEFLKIKNVIDSGILGEIVQVKVCWNWFRRRWDWQTLKKYGGGSLNNDGSHVIDQVLTLFPGSDQFEVFCSMRKTPLCLGDAEDYVKIILRAPNLPVIDLEFSNAAAYRQSPWHIMGTRGGLTGGRGTLTWRYTDPTIFPFRTVDEAPTPGRSYNSEALTWTEESCTFENESYNTSDVRMYVDLYNTIRDEAELKISPESILRQLRVIEQCRVAATREQHKE